MNDEFTKRYNSLNKEQKQAVDIIDGPLMVVAGPGTGKTELLSLRAANILRTTDASPQNILCLTFTESGATAMRQRLAGLIGSDAYKIAIHTFHSFGAETINQQGEYFYNGAHFRPADELHAYEILRSIFQKLPHDNPLSVMMNDDYTYLRDTQSTISDLKKSGLLHDELLKILDMNDAFLSWVQPKVDEAFTGRLSKKSFPAIRDLIEQISAYIEEPCDLLIYRPLYLQVAESLGSALNASESENSTKPLSAWKRVWSEKKPDGSLTLKDEKRARKLRAVAHVYNDYLIGMQRAELFDFDDMILRVVHALELFDDLRFNLQEKYQYIMIDEFQDTNDAQMRLAWNLSNNPSSEGRPNLMVVGDDDQAIYRFQGANVANIHGFKSRFRDVETITLQNNYRSTQVILDAAAQTIHHATTRLTDYDSTIEKKLTSKINNVDVSKVQFSLTGSPGIQHEFLVSELKRIQDNDSNASIAVIARNHNSLRQISSYLESAGIASDYDRTDDALLSEPVLFLEQLARIIVYIGDNKLDDASALLSKHLSHPAWGISERALYDLSLHAYDDGDKKRWLDIMLDHQGELATIANWLIAMSQHAQHATLEHMLDHLNGSVVDNDNEEAVSPLRSYFFDQSALSGQPHKYLEYLNALKVIHQHVREYAPSKKLALSDFVEIIDKYQSLGITIHASTQMSAASSNISLLTAHRSKGLEFDHVFVVDLVDSVWGETSRGRSRLIRYPHNLSIGNDSDDSDEKIRLLYVAMTRAKQHLHLLRFAHSTTGKGLLKVGYLDHIDESIVDSHDTSNIGVNEGTIAAHDHRLRLTSSEVTRSLEEMLAPILEKYQLSATHLGNYLDVSRHGPSAFLLRNILRFPESMSASAAYGSAIHDTLRDAHQHVLVHSQQKPLEDTLGYFQKKLASYRLDDQDIDRLSKRGLDALSQYMSSSEVRLSRDHVSEQKFSNVAVDETKLSGAIDLLEIDRQNKTITVIDYKTGKPSRDWKGKSDGEKIKLHHYRQQLLFYKLLIENSASYQGYTVTKGSIAYVEADADGSLHTLHISYDDQELADFRKLVQSVWHAIQGMAFQDHTDMQMNLRGIQQFESYIIDKYS